MKKSILLVFMSKEKSDIILLTLFLKGRRDVVLETWSAWNKNCILSSLKGSYGMSIWLSISSSAGGFPVCSCLIYFSEITDKFSEITEESQKRFYFQSSFRDRKSLECSELAGLCLIPSFVTTCP